MADTQLAPTSPRTAVGLVPPAAIEALARKIAAQLDPERIYLFGSYAYGQPTPNSDVDIMVVMEADDMRGQERNVRRDIRFDYPADILVRTPAFFAERLALGDFFIEQIAEQGRVLYDSGRPTLRNAILHPLVDKNAKEKVGMANLKKLTAEWVKKGERDFISATREARVTEDINYDLICYLAQQCAEKYLKAFLQEHDVHFAKTHNLLDLLNLCLLVDPGFAQWQGVLSGFSKFAVEVRYPGYDATPVQSQSAYQDITRFRAFVRTILGI
jgi:predicted nucleotidyltransferase